MTSNLLALANTVLVAVGLISGLAGYRAIRARRERRHRTLMLVAFVCSALFLALFILRFALFGFAPYSGQGGWRVAYYIILFAHEPLAVISVPLVCVALVLGLRRHSAHVEIARPAAIIWLISAITGILLFVWLYVL